MFIINKRPYCPICDKLLEETYKNVGLLLIRFWECEKCMVLIWDKDKNVWQNKDIGQQKKQEDKDFTMCIRCGTGMRTFVREDMFRLQCPKCHTSVLEYDDNMQHTVYSKIQDPFVSYIKSGKLIREKNI